MLPFTKRPGRGGEDGEVFTKDDLDDLAATNEKPATASPPSKRPAAKDDFSDDEVTNFIPSKSVSAIVQDARKPATIPPPPASRRPPASIPPPPMSQRPGKFLTSQSSSHVSGADEDEDGRTVVRGAPKIVKKAMPSVPPPAMAAPSSSMSPAAVIKATLESARAAKRANEGALMPPPPAELLEDMTDRLAPDDPRLAPMSSRPVSSARGHHSVPPPPQSQRPQMMQSPYTAPMGMQPVGVSELGATMLAGMGPSSQPAPSSHGPMTGPPPPMHLAHGYAPASPSGSIPPPPQSYRPPNSYANNHAANQTGPHQMPAHFMVPNAPYSDGRMDPPGTSVTARHRTPGRPASAWAMALVAAGLFVGVGAVAVMQSNDSLMDTTASFVDPSRAGAPKAAAQPAAPEPAPQAAPTTAIAPTVVVPPAVNPDPAPQAGGVIGASAPAGQPPVAVAAQPAAPAQEPKPEAKAATAAVAANPAPTAPKTTTTWIAPTPKPQAPVAAAPAPAPAPKPAAAAPKPAVASNEDAPEKPVKPTGGKGPKGGKGDATDDETKKALEALQKAQLESGF